MSSGSGFGAQMVVGGGGGLSYFSTQDRVGFQEVNWSCVARNHRGPRMLVCQSVSHSFACEGKAILGDLVVIQQGRTVEWLLPSTQVGTPYCMYVSGRAGTAL